MQKLFIIIALTLQVTNSIGQSLQDLSFGTDNTFEVITWNIEWFPKNGQTTADSVGRIIEALDADVYAIQEIDDTALFRQTIANIPEYELFIHPGYFAGLGYVYNTTAVNVDSIYKIYDTPTYWHNFPRAPVVMELNFGSQKIVVINNHLKCCGDGTLDVNNTNDEEARRYNALTLLKTYIDSNFQQQRVILVGDLNDVLTDIPANNVFQSFIDDSTNYQFVDMDIATGSTGYWSYPNWPSHIDHILITKTAFDEFADNDSEVKTLKIEHNLAFGWSWYDSNISDHRPVALKLKVNPTQQIEGSSAERFLKVYPNPTADLVTLEYLPLGSEGRVEVLSSAGQPVYSGKLLRGQSRTVIDFDEFATGLYTIIIQSESRVLVSRRVVVR